MLTFYTCVQWNMLVSSFPMHIFNINTEPFSDYVTEYPDKSGGNL